MPAAAGLAQQNLVSGRDAAPHRGADEVRLTLAGMEPAGHLAGSDPSRWKCIADGRRLIVYLAHTNRAEPAQANPAENPPGAKHWWLPTGCPRWPGAVGC